MRLKRILRNIVSYHTPQNRNIQAKVLMIVNKMTLYKVAALAENMVMSQHSAQMIIAIIIPRSPEI